MDITNMVGGNNVTIDVVKSSPTKILVPITGGAMKLLPNTKDEKLCLLVEMDSKQLSWIPNKTSMKNVAAKYGMQTDAWVGKKIALETGIINGKEAVIAKPMV